MMRDVSPHQIHWDDLRFRFRFDAPDRNALIGESVRERGQSYSVTLLEHIDGGFIILDGFARCFEARSSGRSLRARVLPANTTAERLLYHLCETNMTGEYQYGVVEKGRALRAFKDLGLSVSQIAQVCDMHVHDVEDHICLAAAPSPLAESINAHVTSATVGLLFYRRTLGWHRVASPALVHKITSLVLNELKGRHIDLPAMRLPAMRFVLDFFWQDGRPFMARVS
jgi:hypothetical protein